MSKELAAMFGRDIKRLIQEIQAFSSDDDLWKTAPGVTNSAGNLALHLEGNLREYVGRQLGGVAYTRTRDLEFSRKGVSAAELVERLSGVLEIVPRAISGLSDAQLDAIAAEKVTNQQVTNRQFLFHLYGHFSYHLGQIDYLRRILTTGKAVTFAGL
jgi:hypothetical protein